MLVTSDPDKLDPPLAELKLPLSDCRTSELGDVAGRAAGTSSLTLVLTLPLRPVPLLFMLRKRPPQPLARRIACRWRDSCRYGCRNENSKQEYHTSPSKKWINVLEKVVKIQDKIPSSINN